MHRVAAIVLLLLTASLKVAALGHESPVLDQQDAVFRVPLRTVQAGALAVELLCVGLLFRARDAGAAALVVLCFIVPASLYRLAVHLSGGAGCPCLGHPAAWWPWLANHEGVVLNTVAAWLFLSSVCVVMARLRP